MTIGLLKNILTERPKDVRLLGLDMGSKTIGLALSDPGQSIATPLQTIRRTKFTRDVEALKTVIDDYEVGGYVLGYPLNMDGSEGPRCQSVRDFAIELAKRTNIVGDEAWMALWDERLSTETVDSFLIESVDMSRTKRKQVIDKMAAQVILQGALDFIQAATDQG